MKAAKAITKIAKMNGVSRKTVYQDMLDCMREAQKSPDPEARAIWASIPRKGKEVTPEEFIEYVAKCVEAELQKQ